MTEMYGGNYQSLAWHNPQWGSHSLVMVSYGSCNKTEAGGEFEEGSSVCYSSDSEYESGDQFEEGSSVCYSSDSEYELHDQAEDGSRVCYSSDSEYEGSVNSKERDEYPVDDGYDSMLHSPVGKFDSNSRVSAGTQTLEVDDSVPPTSEYKQETKEILVDFASAIILLIATPYLLFMFMYHFLQQYWPTLLTGMTSLGSTLSNSIKGLCDIKVRHLVRGLPQEVRQGRADGQSEHVAHCMKAVESLALRVGSQDRRIARIEDAVCQSSHVMTDMQNLLQRLVLKVEEMGQKPKVHSAIHECSSRVPVDPPGGPPVCLDVNSTTAKVPFQDSDGLGSGECLDSGVFLDLDGQVKDGKFLMSGQVQIESSTAQYSKTGSTPDQGNFIMDGESAQLGLNYSRLDM